MDDEGRSWWWWWQEQRERRRASERLPTRSSQGGFKVAFSSLNLQVAIATAITPPKYTIKGYLHYDSKRAKALLVQIRGKKEERKQVFTKGTRESGSSKRERIYSYFASVGSRWSTPSLASISGVSVLRGPLYVL